MYKFSLAYFLTHFSYCQVLDEDVESGRAVPGHLDDLLPYAKMISPLLAGVAAHQDSKQSGAGAPRMVEVLTAVWQV